MVWIMQQWKPMSMNHQIGRDKKHLIQMFFTQAPRFSLKSSADHAPKQNAGGIGIGLKWLLMIIVIMCLVEYLAC